MFGLPRAHSALIYSLFALSAVTVPYSAYMFMAQHASEFHESADALAESLIEEGATLTVIPVDTKSKTVDKVNMLGAAPIKIIGMKLEQQDDVSLLDNIEQLADLRSLELRRLSVSGLSLLSLVERLHPEMLSIKFISVKDAAEDEKWVQEISNRLKKLKTLDLQGMPIDDEDIQSLAGNSSITSLNLADTSITDAAIVSLSGLPLTMLRVGRTEVTSQGLRSIPNTVKVLSLEGLPVGDEDIFILADRMTSLANLNLRDTLVTDAGIPALLRMSTLKQLSLRGTEISPEGIARLKQGLPSVTVQD